VLQVEETLSKLNAEITSYGGRAYLVGGAVRDRILNIEPTDYDVEVFGLEYDLLDEVLRKNFKTIEVGSTFRVFKLVGLDIDVTLPRSVAVASKGSTETAYDSAISIEDALGRRDFTINSIAEDLETGRHIDPFHGLDDLHTRTLRYTSKRFSEDPLRVYRGARFIAKYLFTPAEETIELCSMLSPSGIAEERIFAELTKILLSTEKPSLAFEFLREVDWIKYWPELYDLIDCKQDPDHHPEGDVWVHTMHALNAYAKHRIGDEREDLIVGLAVLLHDIGKPASFLIKNGSIKAYGRIKS